MKAAPVRLLVSLPLLLLAQTGCDKGASTAGTSAPPYVVEGDLIRVPPNSPLRTQLVVAEAGGGAASALELPATVEADPARVANVSAPLAGRVSNVLVSIGQTVRKGQLLAEVDSGDFAQAHSDVVKADDAAELAKRAMQRAEGVLGAGGAAEKDVEAARSAFAQAEAERTRAHARLRALSEHARGGKLALTSPEDGVVTAMNFGRGASVNDPTAALLTVTDTREVYVTALLPEGQAGSIKRGQPVEIRLTNEAIPPLKATIGAVNAVLEADTRRQKLRIPLANRDGRLLPNMYASVRVTTGQGGAVWAPQSALLMNNDTVTVFVEVSPWVFRRQRVELGDENQTSAEIVRGLKAGDRIVARGGILLND